MIFDDSVSSHDIGVDFIAHYGVKGMHWGIRKDVLTSSKNPFSAANPDFVRNRSLATTAAGTGAAVASLVYLSPMGAAAVGIGAAFVRGIIHDISMGQRDARLYAYGR